MTRHRDAADARRQERRRAAHPVQVTAGAGVVQAWTGVGLDRVRTDLTPTEARALAGVLVAVAGDVERRAPADLDAAIHRGATDAEREPLREVVRARVVGSGR